jgi:hypothetical protein
MRDRNKMTKVLLDASRKWSHWKNKLNQLEESLQQSGEMSQKNILYSHFRIFCAAFNQKPHLTFFFKAHG